MLKALSKHGLKGKGHSIRPQTNDRDYSTKEVFFDGFSS